MGWGAGARTPARLGHTLRGLLDVGGDRTGEAGSLAEPAGHLAALDGTNSVRQVSLQLSQVVEVLGELGFGHGESLSAAG